MIVGTAGHIDHGKTSLIKALTGVDGDRLKEEKARGITIDLGFAYLPLSDTGTLGFVDVPGHERFVHTMVAGASGIDIALLVVAVDDGVMPQTLEHLAILDLLQIRRGVIALTKVDLAPPGRLAEVGAQIRAATAGTALGDADMFPVSSATGLGIDALRERLATEARTLGERAADGRFRLAVDRVFTLPGIGLTVTGTVLSGTVRVKDQVLLSPSGLSARVRSLHAQNHAVELGRAGDRCALNLSGEDIAKDAIHRGDMVVDPFLHAPVERIDARLRLLPGESKPMSQWFPARLHHGASEVGVRVVLVEGEQLAPGQAADVQLVLSRPIAAAALDRFVLRDVSAQRTIGGGQFLDLRGPPRQRRTAERQAQRAALLMSDPLEAFAALLDAPPFAWDLAAFARDRALSASRADDIAAALAPVIFADGGERIAIGRPHWQHFVARLVECLGAFHTANPDLQGIGRERLRLALQPRLPASAFAQALQHPDLAERIVRDGAFVRLPGHTLRLNPEREALWQAIAPLLDGEARFRPPRVRDLAWALGRQEPEVRQLLRFAARLGRADEVAHDHFFLRATMHEMALIAAALAAEGADGRFTAAQFRDRLDNGRKVAIQILEFFDRQGVTLNRGTLRRVQARYLDLFAPAASATHGRESSPVGRPDFKSG
ncbi:selenocysteine-specific translation elongation factor [Dyella sp. LX-66]|uniref:selenocysteine-specific translation elongation factor n=1 Tax=unclassified Dyella TaxID=2634549 RepID=UPI001BE0D1BF|nr:MULTISPECIES: selenocysteine-specific translation elongation factor [unclassified Dyella]MBT2118852.1 selenocysteine-specific translation elongation factor [Dyella sp. LX-1]MBT2140155.1 selenocysteine-specific translation elongation factor [Dyella sp. LX-66]